MPKSNKKSPIVIIGDSYVESGLVKQDIRKALDVLQDSENIIAIDKTDALRPLDHDDAKQIKRQFNAKSKAPVKKVVLLTDQIDAYDSFAPLATDGRYDSFGLKFIKEMSAEYDTHIVIFSDEKLPRHGQKNLDELGVTYEVVSPKQGKALERSKRYAAKA